MASNFTQREMNELQNIKSSIKSFVFTKKPSAGDNQPPVATSGQNEILLITRLNINLSKLPEMDPKLIVNGAVNHPTFEKCPDCSEEQPVKRLCPCCGNLRFFVCFPTRCSDLDLWKNWQCRYCRRIPERFSKIFDPIQVEGQAAELPMAWLQQEKVERFRAMIEFNQEIQDKRELDTIDEWSCFNCPRDCSNQNLLSEGEGVDDPIDTQRMDLQWFCERCRVEYNIFPLNVENYCYLCRSPQPVSPGNCEGCGKIYRFDCFYPFKCIGTTFGVGVGTERWTHCEDCIGKMEFVDVSELITLEISPPQIDQ